MKTHHAVRNIAIIAHVDHGKTTLVDQLLKQSGTFRSNQVVNERIMDSNDLEKERGITILAKNCAVQWKEVHINIIDTPGHADFGGEVERVLSMVDGVLLLIDAVDGPMPQTRFVTRKALAKGLCPIVVVNKVDRPGARPSWVINQAFELFDKLGASEAQLDFPVVYTSALQGFARLHENQTSTTMAPLFDLIVSHVPQLEVNHDAALQLQICSLDHSSYLGKMGIGRITAGKIRSGQTIAAYQNETDIPITAKISTLMKFQGLERRNVETAEAGDIVLISGFDEINIGMTLCEPTNPNPLPALKVDEPTLSMFFIANSSPLAGKEGKYITSRNLRDRLMRELKSNVALRVKETQDTDTFEVCGRGELHLTILLENMRREGYELMVSRPQVIYHEDNGKRLEPYEMLSVDVEGEHQGVVMQALGERRAELIDLIPDNNGRIRLEYRIPARGLIGFHGEFLTMTRGSGMMSHVFDAYDSFRGEISARRNGVLISQDNGESVAYALWKLQERGRMFVRPGEPVYEGMIIGIHSRDNDLVVNPIRTKQLTNIRASGKDEHIALVPPVELTLEYAVEFIADDEYVEITPQSIRLRKRYLKEHERKKAEKLAVI